MVAAAIITASRALKDACKAVAIDLTKDTSTSSISCKSTTETTAVASLCIDPKDASSSSLYHLDELKSFQKQAHSLRLSASQIAALVGLNPYTDLPEVLCKLVYQTRLGQRLLKHDVKLLGLTLQSPEDILLELAKKAGVTTARAFENTVLAMQDLPAAIPKTIQDVKDAQIKVMKDAETSGSLTVSEKKQLREGVRRAVSTTYGTHHEDEALDCYEKMVGCEVLERNAEMISWPFVKAEDVLCETSPKIEIVDNHLHEKTVVPMSKPTAIVFHRKEKTTNEEAKSETNNAPSNESCYALPKSANWCKPPLVGPKHHDTTLDKKTDSMKKFPFFTILGKIDGIRDEVWFDPDQKQQQDDDDDIYGMNDFGGGSWVQRPVIIECKHRVSSRPFNPPPLYEQIQATAYSFMYGVNQAEIVQVLRRQHKKPRRLNTAEKKYPEIPTQSFSSKGATSNDKLNERDQVVSEKLPTTSLDCNAQITNALSSSSEIQAMPITTNNINKKVITKTATGVDSNIHKSLNEEHNASISSNSPTNTQYAENITINAKMSKEPIIKQHQNHPINNIDNKSELIDNKEKNQNNNIAIKKEKEKNNYHNDAKIEIVVSRVSMDDPNYNHRQNWQNIILPRLRSLVEAVYRIRSNDDKRYRLLSSLAVVSAANEEEKALSWNVLLEECPWLRDCDTAYQRLC